MLVFVKFIQISNKLVFILYVTNILMIKPLNTPKKIFKVVIFIFSVVFSPKKKKIPNKLLLLREITLTQKLNLFLQYKCDIHMDQPEV